MGWISPLHDHLSSILAERIASHCSPWFLCRGLAFVVDFVFDLTGSFGLHPTVRSDCMESLGALLEFYPQMFLKDQTVKYLGWTLYDKVGGAPLSAD